MANNMSLANILRGERTKSRKGDRGFVLSFKFNMQTFPNTLPHMMKSRIKVTRIGTRMGPRKQYLKYSILEKYQSGLTKGEASCERDLFVLLSFSQTDSRRLGFVVGDFTAASVAS